MRLVLLDKLTFFRLQVALEPVWNKPIAKGTFGQMVLDCIEGSKPGASPIGTEYFKFIYELIRKQIPTQLLFSERCSANWTRNLGLFVVGHQGLQTPFAESVLAGRHLGVVEDFGADLAVEQF